MSSDSEDSYSSEESQENAREEVTVVMTDIKKEVEVGEAANEANLSQDATKPDETTVADTPMSPSPEPGIMTPPIEIKDSPASPVCENSTDSDVVHISSSPLNEPKESSESVLQNQEKASEKVGSEAPKEAIEPDTELVSEDEFPLEGVKHLDTEAVSDEELQELPGADLETEAVSDDELPPVKKKRKHRRHSGSDDDHSSFVKKKKRRHRSSVEKKSSHSRSHGKEKKHGRSPKSSSKGRNRDPSPRRKPSSKSSSKSKVLPELEKYWKAVRDDPGDFTGWTYLLQYVDQENDVEAAREAYDSFLRIYPYCYGYWRKYADYEKHKGDRSKCEEVFSRGLKAIPLSVDLWLHYLNFCKSTMKDNESGLRDQFERAIERCGLEFRSDRLWDFYKKWEMDLKNYQNVLAIYDRLLKTPVLGYKTHFENFEDFVHTHQPSRILSVGEFVEVRADVVQTIKERGIAADGITSAPPGDDPNEDDDPSRVDGETTLMREKIIAIRKKVFKNTAAEVAKRWKFEEGIKRPYFHVKPLEKCQVNSWRDYLDFEIANGDMHRTVILFERCLIACALYEEFWLKYIFYLENAGESDDLIRNVYQRACLIHHCKKTYLALEWASFEEIKGNIEGARKVLNYAEKQVPNLLLIYLRRINLERRAKNLEGAAKLYEYYLKNNSRNPTIFNALSAKYARFCHSILNDTGKAIEVMKRAIDKYPDDLQPYVALLDLYMTRESRVQDCIPVFNKVLSRDSIDRESKIIFGQRKIEFLEDYGCDISEINKAHAEYSTMLKKVSDPTKHSIREDKLGSDDSRAKLKGEAAQGHAASSCTGSTTYSGSSYNGSYQSSQGYSNPSTPQYSQASYSTPSNNQYGTTDQNSSNYHNWNYSQSSYGSSGQSWGGYNYYS